MIELLPPERPLELLDVGCGEGRNVLFFAQHGFQVTAFDLSPRGVEKTRKLAEDSGLPVQAFTADLITFRLKRPYDVILAAGSLHHLPRSLRGELLNHYRQFTCPGGLNAFSVVVEKPFIPRPPHEKAPLHPWISGEILTHYHDWKIEFFAEAILEDRSGAAPHRHAVNSLIARKDGT